MAINLFSTMPKLIKVDAGENTFHYQFMCPACKITHEFNDKWWFNGDYEEPTVTPSILVEGYKFDENHNSVPFRCHSWITRGKIKFFADCSHEMAEIAGEKWFELPELK